MSCQMFGVLTMLVAVLAAVACSVGSATLIRYPLYRKLFRYIGWPLVAIVAGAVCYTSQGAVTAFQSVTPSFGILIFVISGCCYLTETAMLAGLLLMIGGIGTDGKNITIRTNSVVDRVLRWRWDRPYTRKSGAAQDICGISWLIAANLAASPIAFCVMCLSALVEAFSIFCTGGMIGKDGTPGGGKRVLAFSPAIALLISALIGVAVWASIRHFLYLPPEWSVTFFLGIWAIGFTCIAVRYQRSLKAISGATGVLAETGIPLPRAIRDAIYSFNDFLSAAKEAACPKIASVDN